MRFRLTAAMAALALLLLFPAGASALHFQWIGGATGNWNDPNEWDTIDTGGSEAAWPSTAGDFVFFPATITSAVTVTIPTGVNAAFGVLQILTNSTVTIQRAGTGQIIVSTLSEVDDGDIIIQGTGDHVIAAPMRMDKHVLVHVANDASTLAFSGGIGQTGVRNLTKNGQGSVRFVSAVNNTYTGTTIVQSGILELLHSSGTTAIAGPLVIGQDASVTNTGHVVLFAANQIANTSDVTIRRYGIFLINGHAETIAILTILNGATLLGPTGDLTISGLSMSGGSIGIGNAGSTLSLLGNVTAASSTVGSPIVQSDGGTFSLSGGDRTFTVDDGPFENDLVVDAPIVGLAGDALFKDGTGVMGMGSARANTYTGLTFVREGRLDLNKTAATAIAGALIVGDNVGDASSARVRLTAANQIANASIVEIASDGLLDMNSQGDTFNLLDVIGGTVLVGPVSDLTTGEITLVGGTIGIGASAALRLNGNIQASSAAAQSGTIGGTGTLHLNGGSRSFVVADGPQPIDLRIDANIAATAAEILAKSGPGVALFAGTGTYAGETVIGDGTLLVNGTLNPTGFVLPSAPTATLGGTGNVGSVAIGAGRLAPGLSPGIITTHGLGIGAGFPLVIELNGTTAGAGYDQVRVLGQVFVGLSVIELTVGAGFNPPPGSTFTIVDNDGTDPISGTFVGLDEGATVSISGGHDFRISYVGGDGNDIVLSHIGEISYYLAEGATGEFFDNDVLIANPNTADAPVKLTFLMEGGTTIVETRTVAAQSRITVNVESISGLESASASVQVTSTSGVPLVVERTMSWDSTYYGGHTANAVVNPATRWTFAEGFQGFFDTYVLIANVTATPTTATLLFLREGEAPFITSVPVGAFSRKTVYAGDYPELVGRAFGVVVDAGTVPVVAERAMYFASVPGKFWGGGHVNTGTTTPSTTWFHAEGATGTFFNTFILLSNPFPGDASVTLQFLLQSGEVIERRKTVRANERLTINPASEGDARLENASLSTVVTSDAPIVSERSMYWAGDASPFGEGHNSTGIVSTGLRWGLAEGRIGGQRAYDTYILLTNATTGPAEVRVTYLREGGAVPVVKTYTVPATSRFNIDVRSMVPELSNENFGALIESLNSVNIAVERSLYWTANGIFWAGGTNALGTPLP